MEGWRKPEHVRGNGQKQAIGGGGDGEEEEEEKVDRMNSCICDLDNFPFHGDKTTISAVSRHRRHLPWICGKWDDKIEDEAKKGEKKNKRSWSDLKR